MRDTERTQFYYDSIRNRLRWLMAMWEDPLVQCYGDAKLPDKPMELEHGAVFLGGPTSRGQILEYNWRCEAVFYLRSAGYKGWIYVPEPRGVEKDDDFTEKDYIHSWESSRLMTATDVVFWVPRNSTELMGLNTNFEFGFQLARLTTPDNNFGQRIYLGWPHEAVRMGLPYHYCRLSGLSSYEELEDLCQAVISVS